MKSCPIHKCGVMIRPDRLMCAEHWRLVQKPLQDTIWGLYNQGKTKEGHLEACSSAIEQVNSRVTALRNSGGGGAT